ncbi:MAG: Response regulator receiver protein [Verrucomicrobiales bacterium]|nr:Response regulator receiver protein [Verrucomicrobiales bacterium]
MPYTILLVEDDEGVLALISSALSKEGYRVFGTTGTMEAEQLWTNPGSSIDLLITDVRLGGEDNGFVLAKEFVAAHPDVPVIFVSGDRDCFASPSIQLFADSPFIPKPFEIKKMLAKVAEVLAKTPGTN